MRKLEGIVIHRTEAGTTGEEVNAHENPNSYHMFIAKDGRVDRMVSPDLRAEHARNFNSVSIGIAVYGDFAPAERSKNVRPTPCQLSALVGLCVELRATYGDLWIKGHTELGPGGTFRVEKLTREHACPGENLDMNKLRQAVKEAENTAVCI